MITSGWFIFFVMIFGELITGAFPFFPDLGSGQKKKILFIFGARSELVRGCVLGVFARRACL